MSNNKNIFIKGARVNNLKNVDVEIPRDKFVVITGLSGSGKSSLAFDTLYAEGQRRYVESLSSYARQFLGRMNRPECDYIKGIPPAIAIEQKTTARNPRSTVGTSTEIYEYLRLLYARIGKTISPVSGLEVKKHQISDVVEKMKSYPADTRLVVLSKFIQREGRTVHEQLEMLQKEGFSRMEYQGAFLQISEMLTQEAVWTIEDIHLVIDRLTCDADETNINRFAESVETAFYEGYDECYIVFYPTDKVEKIHFSKRFEADGITFQEPTDMMFSFNNPVGACPMCEGYGKVLGVDEDLVVPDKSLSVIQDAIMCWRGEKMVEWKNQFIRAVANLDFPVHRPYHMLKEEHKNLLWHGDADKGIDGIDHFFKMVEENQYKIQYRVMLARYRGKTTCPACKGTRLKPQALYVLVGGKSIGELVLLPIDELQAFFNQLALNETDAAIVKRLLVEINNRISYLINVGLSYLTLNRLSNTLSGGESQRINLATSLGSSLVGSLYILDEPSIGLHSRDTDLLINVLRALTGLGNTVVVVEHDEEIIRAADYVIDVGPKAGRLGGEIVYQGTIPEMPKKSESFTVKYLTGEDKIMIPQRRKWNNYLEIKGARQNNLKNIDVKFPLNAMTVVTGVSGSGKSSLVCEVFYNALEKYYLERSSQIVQYDSLGGDLKLIKQIEMVDQSPIGKSTRSNAVTYLKVYDEIRKLFSEQQLAKKMHLTPSYFSFNIEGGRCEECQGEGFITVEMQFMANVVLQCESCKGKRFKKEILDIEYKGKNIFDILDMTIDQGIEFFSSGTGSQEAKIAKKLQPLQDVGLGYIKMGQSSSTLSGGENQRVKLAFHLAAEKMSPTLFIFDEPTTGLHFHDIKTLLLAFDALIDRGHTVLIIEHNMDVIKCADHIIDIGPEGGKNGGSVVVTGTPEEVAACEESYTGKFLKEKLEA